MKPWTPSTSPRARPPSMRWWRWSAPGDDEVLRSPVQRAAWWAREDSQGKFVYAGFCGTGLPVDTRPVISKELNVFGLPVLWGLVEDPSWLGRRFHRCTHRRAVPYPSAIDNTWAHI